MLSCALKPARLPHEPRDDDVAVIDLNNPGVGARMPVADNRA